MTFQTILTGIKLLIQLLGWMQSRGYIEQGRREERAAQMEEVTRQLHIALGVEEDLKGKSDEEVTRIAEEKGWYRD